MKPATYELELTENSTNTLTFTISGITTAVDYSAAIDIRNGSKPTDTLLLALTSNPAAGLVLSSNGSSLAIALTITEAQTDLLAPQYNPVAMWSLKVTDPAGDSLQYLVGKIVMTRTPTA